RRAVMASSTLPDVAACGDQNQLRASPGSHINEPRLQDIKQLRRSLARASAFSAVGQRDQEREVLEDARRLAQTLGSDSLIAVIDQRRGEVLREVGDYPAAEEVLESAYIRAGTVGQSATQLASALSLAIIASEHTGDLKASTRWERF